MKEILKDYGTLIGPTFAFTLGIIAIYIKFYSDRQLEVWRSNKKMNKLIKLIIESKPPSKFYPNKSETGLHADEAKNLTNLSIFYNRLQVLISYINTVENDILTNCNIDKIQQFKDLKFIAANLFKHVEKYRENVSSKNFKESNMYFEGFEEHHFMIMKHNYDRLLDVCINPEMHFKYMEI